MEENMTILISGASGFVGTNLQVYLSEKQPDVKIEKLAREYLDKTDFLLHDEVNNKPIDVIVHLAGKSHDLKKVSLPEEYYLVNFELTKKLFDKFLKSDAKKFILMSSVKAAADEVEGELTEAHIPNPITQYGKSKLLAEQYMLSKEIPEGKRIYILRPCMIHGPGNKGNLNLLYKMFSKGLLWPLGSFDNKRSFCSIDNICFIINELIDNDKIPSGVYNIADDEPLSTNDLIKLIAFSLSKKPFILNTPKFLVKCISKFGDALKLPLNTERLSKLTEIKKAINKPMPVSASEGLLKTFNSFNNAQ